MQESAPFVGKQRAVGLDDVRDVASATVLLLKLQSLAIEGEWTHERFAAVPCEKDVVHGLGLNVFLCELIEHFLAQHTLG